MVPVLLFGVVTRLGVTAYTVIPARVSITPTSDNTVQWRHDAKGQRTVYTIV